MIAPDWTDLPLRIGESVALLFFGAFSGYHAWKARQNTDHNNEDILAAKEAAKQASDEIHETKVAVEATKAVVAGDGNGLIGLRKMLENHIDSNDARLLTYRGLLDETVLRQGRIDEEQKALRAMLVEISSTVNRYLQSITTIEGSLGKLEHSSARHSEQINILIDAALKQRSAG